MSDNIDFRRFDESSKMEGFKYNSDDTIRDLDHDFKMISMDQIGFNIKVSIGNYMAEAVMMGGNLRADPIRIKSLRRDDVRPRDDIDNCVVVTILTTENSAVPDPKKRLTKVRKTEIRIPGRMLNQGSVFIAELGCYIMTESQVDATRELIARDVSHPGWDSINIPSSMSKEDPSKLYIGFKGLAQFCIRRQDKINIRIGIDLRYDKVPEHIKQMHISILDSYFVPFTVYKLMYDPTLGPDEFVIENLYRTSRDEFRSTFSELNKLGVMYLEHDEYDTLFGKFYGMGIFANENRYLDYVHHRKTQERFSEETLYVASRSGDPRLKEEVANLQRSVSTLRETNTEQDTQLIALRADNKRLKGDVRDRETALQNLREGHAAKMSETVILAEIDNSHKRAENDTLKIEVDRIDLEQKEKAAPLHHKATILKSIADMMKSTWGIITAVLGGILSLIALAKKYNIKLSMGT